MIVLSASRKQRRRSTTRRRTKERTRTKRQRRQRRKALRAPRHRKHPGGGGFTDLGWMFAAYVNEGSPIVDQILNEALATRWWTASPAIKGTRRCDARAAGRLDGAAGSRHSSYSNITATAGGSAAVHSQHVRFVDESIANQQANCADGSVLFCVDPAEARSVDFPRHSTGPHVHGLLSYSERRRRVAIETTMIGTSGEKSRKQRR